MSKPRCPHCRGKKKSTENLCVDHFEALKKEWYSKLEGSGFEDIEDKNGQLKIYSTFKKNRTENSTTYINSKIEYYEKARQFLYDNKFESDLHREIWSQHSEGEAIRAIAEKHSMTKDKVFYVIKSISTKMLGYYGISK